MKNKVIFILGMHRSGTSALAGALAAARLNAGKHMLETIEKINAKGFWENRELVRINELILNEFSKRWYYPFVNDFIENDKSKLSATIAEDARKLIADEFAGNPISLIKDPRLCFTAILWKNWFEECGFDVSALHIYRHPQEVAVSLYDRDLIDELHACALWIEHVRSAEQFGMSVPFMRLCYRDLVHSADSIGKDIFAFLDSESVDLEGFSKWIDPSKHRQTLREDSQFSGLLPNKANEIFQKLYDAAVGEKVPLSEFPKWTEAERELITSKSDQFQQVNLLNIKTIEQGHKIEIHRQQVEKLESALAEDKAYIEALDNIIASQKSDIKTQEEVIQSQQEVIKTRELDIEAQQEVIKTGELDIEAQKEVIKTRELDIEAQKEVIKARELDIEAQKEVIKTRELDIEAQMEQLNVLGRVLEHEQMIRIQQDKVAQFIRDILLKHTRHKRLIQIDVLLDQLVLRFPFLRKFRYPIQFSGSASLQRSVVARYFDSDYYINSNPDVVQAKIDPLDHYLSDGWREGRKPSLAFDLEVYDAVYPVVRRANLNPLLHFVSDQKKASSMDGSRAANERWGAISRVEVAKHPKHIAVIVPVYRDVELTRLCLLAALPDIIEMQARLIIINDKSPDSGMREMLQSIALQYQESISLLENRSNLGFVASVNKGIKEAGNADVVLLNSDAIVGGKWLEQLAREAYSAPNVGTVTPLSNNTTISSFPNFLSDNDLPYGLDLETIQSVFAEPILQNIVTPTGVGFCFYIVRACIDDVGVFDESKFGRGYGEENDFCQRAIGKKWINVLTPNVYVSHKGSVSFGAEKDELVTSGLKILDQLHSGYRKDVSEFCTADPLLSARVFRQLQLMKLSGKPVILHVSHGLGGGVRQHINELSEFLADSAISILLEPVVGTNEISLLFDCSDKANSIQFDLTSELGEFRSIIKAMAITDIHYHHLMNVPPPIVSLAKDLGIPYQITVHDFYFLNGNPSLVNDDYVYPGKYSDSIKNERYKTPGGVTPKEWRAMHLDFWREAKSVIFPSFATKKLFDGLYPLMNSKVTWHPESNRDMEASELPLVVNKSAYKVLVLGALSREKGADFLEAIATLAKGSGVRLEFVLIGFSYRALQNVTETGAYNNEDMRDLIEEHQADLIFFPAKWPETYSYTLSSAIESRLPILAPDLGAFPERLRERGNASLYDYKLTPIKMLSLFSSLVQGAATGNGLSVEDADIGMYPKKVEYTDYYNLRVLSPISDVAFEVLDKACRKVRVQYQGTIMYRVAKDIYQHPLFAVLRRNLPNSLVFGIKRLLQKTF